jgi:hypothetical protein
MKKIQTIMGLAQAASLPACSLVGGKSMIGNGSGFLACEAGISIKPGA